MLVSPGFYGQLMTLLSGLAMGRIAVCLEGGYFLPSLAEGVALTLLGLLDDTPATLNFDNALNVKVIEVINDLKFFLHEFWDCFKVIPLLPLQGEANKHSVVVQYLGKAPQSPYETRNCYPVQDTETIEKNTAKIIELQNGRRPFTDSYIYITVFSFICIGRLQQDQTSQSRICI